MPCSTDGADMRELVRRLRHRPTLLVDTAEHLEALAGILAAAPHAEHHRALRAWSRQLREIARGLAVVAPADQTPR